MKKHTPNQIDFANETVGRSVLKASLPMLVAQILNLLYSIVDRVYLGRIPDVGVSALGGVGLCFPVIMLVTAFTNMYGMGGSPLSAMERGKGDRAEAERIMNTSFTLLFYTGIALTLLGEVFAVPMLRAFGASDVTLPFALSYLRIYLIGTIATMLATGLNPFINAQGFSGVGMLTIFIGAAANIILDPFFIFVLHMGIRGAAIATVIAQTLSMGFATGFLRGKQTELRLSLFRLSSLDRRLSLNIISLGLISFIMQITNSLVAVVCNGTLSRFGGDIAVSVYTIVASVRQMLDIPCFSIANGSSPILSYHYGAGAYDKLRKAIRLFSSWCFTYTAVIWLLILLFPEAFIRIFTPDAGLIEAAVPALHIYFFAFIFQSLQQCAQTTFKSLNMKRRAIFFSMFRKVIMVVPLTLLLPHAFGLGIRGVFLAEPISNVIGGTASFSTMYLTVYRRLGRENAA